MFIMRNLFLVKTTLLGIFCYAGIANASLPINLSNYRSNGSLKANLIAQNPSENLPVFEEKPSSEEQPPVEDKPSSEKQPPVEDKPSSEEQPPVEDQPSSGEQPPVEDKPSSGEQPPVEDKPSSGEQPPVEDKPSSTLPENINPSPNPLLFPTQVDEVKASNVQAITLQQAIDLARKNNKDLELASLNLDKSQQQLREALATELPTATASMDFERTDAANIELLRPNDNSVTTSFTTGVELNYNLYTGGRRAAQIKAAEKQVNFDQLDVERISEEIRLNVSNDYYALQAADALVNIEEAAVNDAKQSLRDAQLLEQAGLGTRFDVITAQVDVANRELELVQAIAAQKVARRQLVERIGLAQNVELMAADKIEVVPMWSLPLEETILLAYKNRVELEQFLIQKEIEQQRQKLEIAANKPQVSLFTNYDVLAVANDDVGPADGFGIGARVRWNFYDGGVAKARQEQSKVDENISETRFAQERDRIRFEVETAYYRLQANNDNIETATQSVVLAEESLRLARLRFQAGVGTQSDVITAQTELTRTRGDLLRTVTVYNQQLAALERAVSNLPDNNLFDVP
jgi:outer membrane protein TolC